MRKKIHSEKKLVKGSLFKIGSRLVGADRPCFIIAEAGVNHNGDMALARRLVDTAADAGADAVKFQTYKTDKIYTAHTPKAGYMLKTTVGDASIMDMARRLELPFTAFKKLADYSSTRGIMFLSSPFDESSADFLVQKANLPALKIPSGELTNLPFLEHVAKLERPLIISTGMARLGEVETALETIRHSGNPPVALLHCVSNYPADPTDANLRAMAVMARAFNLPVGFSDHTLGIEIALAAVALGACILEKHFTIDNQLPGPDHQASLNPEQLRELVLGIRRVESALGDGIKRPAAAERDTAIVARKSLTAARAIPAGANLTRRMVAVRRPGTGLPASLLPLLIGRSIRLPVPEGALLTLEMFK